MQCLAILNIDHDPRTIQHVVSRGSGAAVHVVVTVPPVHRERDSIKVTYNARFRSQFGGLRTKQTSRFAPHALLFPPFFEGTLLVACSNLPPPQMPYRVLGGDQDDRDFGTVQYLMRCFKDRGLVCTESIVREATDMIRRRGQVQLLFGDDWNRQLVFPTQNKNLGLGQRHCSNSLDTCNGDLFAT